MLWFGVITNCFNAGNIFYVEFFCFIIFCIAEYCCDYVTAHNKLPAALWFDAQGKCGRQI